MFKSITAQILNVVLDKYKEKSGMKNAQLKWWMHIHELEENVNKLN